MVSWHSRRDSVHHFTGEQSTALAERNRSGCHCEVCSTEGEPQVAGSREGLDTAGYGHIVFNDNHFRICCDGEVGSICGGRGGGGSDRLKNQRAKCFEWMYVSIQVDRNDRGEANNGTRNHEPLLTWDEMQYTQYHIKLYICTVYVTREAVYPCAIDCRNVVFTAKYVHFD